MISDLCSNECLLEPDFVTLCFLYRDTSMVDTPLIFVSWHSALKFIGDFVIIVKRSLVTLESYNIKIKCNTIVP